MGCTTGRMNEQSPVQQAWQVHRLHLTKPKVLFALLVISVMCMSHPGHWRSSLHGIWHWWYFGVGGHVRSRSRLLMYYLPALCDLRGRTFLIFPSRWQVYRDSAVTCKIYYGSQRNFNRGRWVVSHVRCWRNKRPKELERVFAVVWKINVTVISAIYLLLVEE